MNKFKFPFWESSGDLLLNLDKVVGMFSRPVDREWWVCLEGDSEPICTSKLNYDELRDVLLIHHSVREVP